MFAYWDLFPDHPDPISKVADKFGEQMSSITDTHDTTPLDFPKLGKATPNVNTTNNLYLYQIIPGTAFIIKPFLLQSWLVRA